MRFSQDLWLVNFAVPLQAGEAFGDALGEAALAVTVLAPPRTELAQVEAIYDHDPDKAAIIVLLSVPAEALGIPVPEISVRPSPKLDWLKKVAEDFPPLAIARWTVHGAMHRDKVPNRDYALQIDATNAFGTGEHPTTRGCLVMLDKVLQSGFVPQRMADIGCGSGILSMAAVQATQCTAVGVDMDEDSVEIARSNAKTNGLEKNITVVEGMGYAPAEISQNAPYDLIMANIFADPLCELAPDLKKHLRVEGRAILSGILTTQAERVIAAHTAQGMVLEEHMQLGEWSILHLKA